MLVTFRYPYTSTFLSPGTVNLGRKKLRGIQQPKECIEKGDRAEQVVWEEQDPVNGEYWRGNDVKEPKMDSSLQPS